ncbi:hypothetical protein [Treponema pedis]|uniref:Lipoprotein n=1 Tax=Treponema pedis str. T A4 TaxID=1291379 RepID=S5ZXZ4_9SPIR|nr:hypothetical protein [Treponema pedis]AGT42848.1 hypothetical protein TPE_0352 [Treponema pedis str. T A4]
MKQRRMFSILGMLILAVGAVVLTVSCGKVPSKYIGNYSGTWHISGEEGKFEGKWEGSVDKNGKFDMKFFIEDKTVNTTLTVLKTGSFSGSVVIVNDNGQEDKFDIKGMIKDKKVTGTIYEDDKESGIIIGKKN